MVLSDHQRMRFLLVDQQRVIAGIVATVLFVASTWALLMASAQGNSRCTERQTSDISFHRSKNTSVEQLQALSEEIFQAGDHISGVDVSGSGTLSRVLPNAVAGQAS